jgi:hypothetical protein
VKVDAEAFEETLTRLMLNAPLKSGNFIITVVESDGWVIVSSSTRSTLCPERNDQHSILLERT